MSSKSTNPPSSNVSTPVEPPNKFKVTTIEGRDAVGGFLETLGQQIFGRSVKKSKENKECVCCGSDKMNEEDFVDVTSVKEAKISGFCQKCQDDTYGFEDENEEIGNE